MSHSQQQPETLRAETAMEPLALLPPKRRSQNRRKSQLEAKPVPEELLSPVSSATEDGEEEAECRRPGAEEEEEEDDGHDEPEIVKVLLSKPPVVQHANGRREVLRHLGGSSSSSSGSNVNGAAVPVSVLKRASPGSPEEAERAKQARRTVAPAASLAAASAAAPFEAYTEARNVLFELAHRYKVMADDLAMQPPNFAVMAKICQAWLNAEHLSPQLIFSTQKSFTYLMGRFLWQYIVNHSGLPVKGDWNGTGCAMWDHGCTAREGELMCLHGTPMIRKEQIIEMDVSSENGQRALKESPARAKVAQNRWGRQVVQLRNEDAMCCFHDAQSPTGTFSGKSCGLFYSEGPKAQTAFFQIMAFQRACYPAATRGANCLLLPLACYCNHDPHAAPLTGRQTCKVTPFSIPNCEDIDPDEVASEVLLASVRHPAVLVFQCCNPVYRNAKAAATRNCDFKISAPDVIGAMQLVRSLWVEVLEKRLPPLRLPEFRWQSKYQYRNVAFPTGYGDGCRSLFD